MGKKARIDRRRKYHAHDPEESSRRPSKSTIRTTLFLTFLVTIFILSLILLSYPNWYHKSPTDNGQTNHPIIHDQKPVPKSNVNTTEIKQGQNVAFDGRQSFAYYNGHITNYTWAAHKGSLDGPVEWVDYRSNFNRSFAFSTEYFVVLTVKDNWGLVNNTISKNKYNAISIIVMSKHIKFPPMKDVVGHTNQTMDFNATGITDDNGSIVNYTWNFGDVGDSASPQNLSYGLYAHHTYYYEGEYTVTLGVRDDHGEITFVKFKVDALYHP